MRAAHGDNVVDGGAVHAEQTVAAILETLCWCIAANTQDTAIP